MNDIFSESNIKNLPLVRKAGELTIEKGNPSELDIVRNQEDEVELVMRNLKKAKNRSEKRRLLAEFNQK